MHPPVGFEPTVSLNERPQTYAVDHTDIGTSGVFSWLSKISSDAYFLILCTYPDTLYSREKGCEDLWLFFETKRGSVSKKKKMLGGKPGVDNVRKRVAFRRKTSQWSVEQKVQISDYRLF